MWTSSPSARLTAVASTLALCVGVAGACAPQVEIVPSGGAPGTLPTSGAGIGPGGSSGAGAAHPADAGTGVPLDAGTEVEAGPPHACASDVVGRPLVTHAGGAGYTLAPAQLVKTPGQIFGGAAIGDVTGDGRADIVGTDLDEAWVLPQRDDGSIGPTVIIPHSFGNPPSVALVDVDEDGLLDLVLTGWEGLEIIRSLGGGAFAPGTVVPTESDFLLTVADLNRDGHVDVLGTTQTGLHFLYGDGAGSFGAEQVLANSAQAIGYRFAMGDVTGDQIPDLVAVDYLTLTKLVIVPHDGISGLSSTGWSTLSLPEGMIWGLGVGDVNGDGRLDIVVQQDDDASDSSRARLLLGGEGGFGAPVEIGQAHYGDAVRIVDVNADGRNDVVLSHAGWAEVGVVLSSATGFGPHVIYDVPTAASVEEDTLVVGDIDCDGCPDVIVAYVGGLAVFRGQGCGS
jgi:hypothetical protein